MTRKRRRSGTLEADVLSVLWSAPGPLTTAEVIERLTGSPAYTTVQTILARLLVKGAVEREPAGRAHAYTPVMDTAQLTAIRMHAILDRGQDRTAVLQRFVGALRPEEEQAVRVMLAAEQRADAASP